MKKLWRLLEKALSEINSPEIRLIIVIMIMYSISISGLYIKKEIDTKKVTDKYEDDLSGRLNQKNEIIILKDREIDSLHGRIFEIQTETNNEKILLLEDLIKRVNDIKK